MNIKKLIEEYNKLNLNEMAITLSKSGYNWFKEPADIIEIVDKALDVYKQEQNNQRISKGYGICNFNLSGNFPYNNDSLNEQLALIYGTNNFGIKHILRQRGIEFDDRRKCKTHLKEEQVVKALKKFTQCH